MLADMVSVLIYGAAMDLYRRSNLNWRVVRDAKVSSAMLKVVAWDSKLIGSHWQEVEVPAWGNYKPEKYRV